MAKFGSRNRSLSTVGAGLGVIALAVGASALGAGVATAETATSGAYTFTRTVDNASPKIGDTITYTTVSKKSGIDGYISRFTETHAACLTFVPGSAKVTKFHVGGTMTETTETPELTATTLEVTSAGWINNGSKPVTMKTSYTVTASCAPGTVYGSGLAVGATVMGNGFQSSANFANLGPSITVRAADVVDPVDPVDPVGPVDPTGPGTGGGTGSLGSLSGGLGSLSGLFGSS